MNSITRFELQSSRHLLTVGFLFLGAFGGAFITFDPYIANVLAHQVPLTIGSKNIFKLFPYEITVLFFCLILLSVFAKKFSHLIFDNPDRSFIVIFIAGLQSIALTNITRFDLSEVALIVFFIYLLQRSAQNKEPLRLTGLDIINLLFIAAMFLAAINGQIVTLVSSSLTMMKFVLILFLIVNFIRTTDDILFFMKAFVFITLVSSVIAIFQEFIFAVAGIAVIGMVDDDTLRFMFEETPIGRMLRVPAFIGTYKALTFFLVSALLMIFNYFLYKRPFPAKKLYKPLFSFIIIFIALCLTFSKDGFISLLCGLVLSLLLWRRSLIFHFIFALLAFTVAITLIDGWGDIAEILYSELKWGEQRIRINLANDGILGLMHGHTWIGVGVGKAHLYTGNYLNWPVHNSIIQVANDAGLIGLLTYLFLLGYTLLQCIKLSLLVTEESTRWIARSMLPVFVSFVVALQFHPFYLEKFNWLLMGIIQAMTLILLNYSTASGKRGEIN